MICILTESPLAGWDLNFIQEKATRVGLARTQVEYISLTDLDEEALRALPHSVLVPLGDAALFRTTGLRQLSKWHLSPLDTGPEFTARKLIPSFSPKQIKADWPLGLYLELALKRAAEECSSREYVRKAKNFLLNPPLDETLALLRSLRSEPNLSVDIETGRGQINTFGFAWSASDAIAINVLPERCSAAAFFELWSHISTLLEGDARKIMQNGIYEILYCARYGIEIRNFTHDTMVANKFLWPELDKGLDNVGRLYTKEVYWKDDGRVVSSGGGRKDWGNIRDWPKHYRYNCSDTSGTYEASVNQRADLEERGLSPLFYNYLMRLHTPLREMCLRGFPVRAEKQAALVAEYEARSSALRAELSSDLNPRSAKQKIALFKAKGYSIPKKRDKKRGGSRESVDELSLKKLRIKHPEDTDIKALLEIAKVDKALSSYLRTKTDPLDGNVRFSLDPHGTETGRWACYKDPWDRGFNAQTMTKTVKKMIGWDSTLKRTFVQIDLKQAESRFVAYDSCDSDLIRMLEDPTKDIHRYVAAEIFECSEDAITHEQRQLGKKSGHGANYSMAAATFQESCLKEMNLVITKQEANKTLEAYHKLFPGIRRWHKGIRDTVYRERKLTNPIGRVRYFYGRMDDNTCREAYAYRPQSTVPDIINHLMLRLCEERSAGHLDFWLHCQTHDSIILSTTSHLDEIAEFAIETRKWHPEIVLPAGRLIIPVSIEHGSCLGEVMKYERR